MLYLTAKYEMIKVVFGPYFWFAYNIGNVFNCLWIIVWVHELLWLAMIFLMFASTSLLVSAYMTHDYMHRVAWTSVDGNYGSIDDHEAQGITVTTDMTEGLPIRQWILQSTSIRLLLYAFVVNGIPFYATWCVIATHLNIGIVFVYEGGMYDTAASILMLSILTICIGFYMFLDYYKLRFYLQYSYDQFSSLLYMCSSICFIFVGNNQIQHFPHILYSSWRLLAFWLMGDWMLMKDHPLYLY